MEICFATNNINKRLEVAKKLPSFFKILTLEEIGCTVDIPENEDTIEGNALAKAKYIFKEFSLNSFADDSGLEVSALNGEPGVYSARYAGPQRSSEDNIDLVLEKLKDVENRTARFKTVFALCINGTFSTFEGIIEGTLLKERRGTGGFGYDSIFVPNGYSKSFAEMNLDEKNKISHRALALEKLIKFIEKNN